jgi:serine/threonine-protein kinase
MVDDANAPTIPETAAPTHPVSKSVPPRAPDTRYEMRALLGRGGMGEIWAAYDVRVDREVAVKVMRGDGSHDSDLVARFLREARVQGRLEHPAIVPVHDLGIGDEPYFVMKRLAGTTLADVLTAKAKGDADAAERWPLRTLLARLVDVCLAIELAHRRGVIHRDLKPANLMLGDFGEAYVLDWGLARVSEDKDAIRASDLPSDPGQTVAGAMLGTPGYMAPEQVRGEAVDHRADIYALGCILFEILAGEPAVPRASAIEATLAAEEHRPRRTAAGAETAPELDDVCARATAAAPGARHTSARALADDIQRFLDGDRDLSRRRELSAQHAETAERVLATGDRAEAMREAGRAIAIDPENPAAQDLMKRLLFELPDELPAEARGAMEGDRQRATQTALRTSTFAYGVYIALPVIGLALGEPLSWQIAGLALAGLFAMTACWVFTLKPRPPSSRMIALILAGHISALIFGSLIVGPLLIVPVVLVGASAMTQSIPSIDLGWRSAVIHAVALAVPLTLEWTGVTPTSYHVTATGISLIPPGLHLSGTFVTGLFIAIIIVQLCANTVISRNQRHEQERAEQKLHAYSWHLAQLVR